MKKLRWIALIFVILLLIAPISSAEAQDAGLTIYGVIYNGTQGGPLPANQPISLYVYSGESQTGEYSITADSSGVFVFEGVKLSAGDEVVAFTDYEGGVYSTASFTYDPESALPDLSIAIYESTEDNSDVSVYQLTFMLNASDGELRVGEYYLLSNVGDRTWIGSYDESLGFNTTAGFSLPSNAESLWFSGYGLNERFFNTADGFVDSVPVEPGIPSSEIFFSYALPFNGTYAFTKTLNLPVEKVDFLVAEGSGITLEGDGIVYNETIETDTDTALSYSAPGFGAGQSFTFAVVVQSSTLFGSSMMMELGIGLAVMAMSGLGIYFVMKHSKARSLPASAEPVLAEIAQLDEAYAAGELKKSQYQKKRTVLIERIKRLSK